MNNILAFTTPRLNAYFLDKQNQHLVIDLYKESSQFLAGIDVMKDIELVQDCYRKNNIGAYLFFCKENNDFIGFGGVQNQEPLDDGSLALKDEIEFVIMIDSKHGGRGLAYEFSSCFFDLYFKKFPAVTIPARVDKQNLSCLNLLKKLNFVQEGEVAYRHTDSKFYLLRLTNS